MAHQLGDIKVHCTMRSMVREAEIHPWGFRCTLLSSGLSDLNSFDSKNTAVYSEFSENWNFKLKRGGNNQLLQ